MANEKVPPKQVTKKHLAKQERERKQTRIILFTTIVVLAIALGLAVYALIDTFVIKPGKVIASVGSERITVKDYQPQVKYTRLNMINQANQYYYYAQMFGDYGSSFLQTAQNMIVSLNSPVSIGDEVLQTMVEDILLQEEAAKRGISVTDAEVEAALREAFEFYPEGTPVPTTTPTIVNTPTMSSTQIALIQPTETATPLPTATSTPEGWEPTNTATATLPATSTQEPVPADATETSVPTATEVPTITPTATITPTPTPYTTQVYGDAIKSYRDELNQFGIGWQDVLARFKTQLLREKMVQALTADLEPVQEQVWARHILVATEEEANNVLQELIAGEDWTVLAATYSTDTSNKDNGGDLGWFSKGKMVKEFEEAAFALEEGEISQPIKTDFGYHIIQCVGKAKNPLTADEIESLKQATFSEWLEEQKSSRTDIVIADDWLEYVPTTPIVPTALQETIFGQQ